MKELILFIFFLILMIATNGLLDWLYGIDRPFRPMLVTLAVMRPTEYIVIAAMLLTVFVAALKKQLSRMFGKLLQLWIRFVMPPNTDSTLMEESDHSQQQRNHNKK